MFKDLISKFGKILSENYWEPKKMSGVSFKSIYQSFRPVPDRGILDMENNLWLLLIAD